VIFSTTNGIEGREIDQYLGIVFGDAVLGINVFKDFMTGLRDVFGGRSATYEREIAGARETVMNAIAQHAHAMGADAVIGIKLDYETLGTNGGMLMVTGSGTAVRLRGPGGPQQQQHPRPWG